jgi:hypothetical protein
VKAGGQTVKARRFSYVKPQRHPGLAHRVHGRIGDSALTDCGIRMAPGWMYQMSETMPRRALLGAICKRCGKLESSPKGSSPSRKP